MKWIKHHPFVLWLITIGLIMIIFSVIVQNEFTTRDRQDSRIAMALRATNTEQINRQVALCKTQNTGREALQSILDQVADPPPSGAAVVDFSQVEGWNSLTPDLQFFLANLTIALQNQTTDPTFLDKVAENYSVTNPQVDCTALKKKLERTLNATTN